MKSFITFLSILFIIGLTAASSAQNTPDTKPSLKKVGSMQDNLILSLGLTNWVTVPSQVEVNILQSREFSLMMMGERMIPSGKLGFGFGLGFSSQNVHSDAVLNTTIDGSKSYFTKLHDSLDYSVNKVSLNFIDAQLELRLHTAPNQKARRFKFSLGLKGGVLLQSHEKFKDDDATYKRSGIANLNKYQYGLVSRLGYGNVAIGGYYSLVEIFKVGKGPELVPYTIGIYLTL